MIASSLAERISSATGAVQIFERSSRGNFLFARQAHELGWMRDEEWRVYESLSKALSVPMNLYVWIDTSPEECLRRQSLRARPEDGTLDLEWMASIHEKHRKEFGKSLVVDGTLPLEQQVSIVLAATRSVK